MAQMNQFKTVKQDMDLNPFLIMTFSLMTSALYFSSVQEPTHNGLMYSSLICVGIKTYFIDSIQAAVKSPLMMHFFCHICLSNSAFWSKEKHRNS